jgi:hypothetical protein
MMKRLITSADHAAKLNNSFQLQQSKAPYKNLAATFNASRHHTSLERWVEICHIRSIAASSNTVS